MGWRATTSLTATIIGFIGTAGILFYGWWPPLLALMIIIAMNAVLVCLSPMRVVALDTARRARGLQILLLVAFVLLVIIAGLADR